MIPARKWPLFNRVFVAYAKSLLRGHFYAVRVEGLEHARTTLAAYPAVFVSNHASWWDSIVLMWLTNYAFRETGPSSGWALMDDRNLRKIGFFRYLGVFGVDLTSPEDRAAVVDYAIGLLDAPGEHVWIFPQGAERPITEPLHFHPGAARMAIGAEVPVLPMALRYEHGRHPRPVCYVAIGPPLSPSGDPDVDVQAQEQAVRGLLDRLEESVRAASRREELLPVALPGRRPLLGRLATGLLNVFSGGRGRA